MKSLRWYRPAAHHTITLFLVMGASGMALAWMSFNLLHLAMENTRFIGMHGLVALLEGGLRQIIEIMIYGILSLVSYLVFKVCEVELVARWRGPAEDKN
jgi:hypothetical protein